AGTASAASGQTVLWNSTVGSYPPGIVRGLAAWAHGNGNPPGGSNGGTQGAMNLTLSGVGGSPSWGVLAVELKPFGLRLLIEMAGAYFAPSGAVLNALDFLGQRSPDDPIQAALDAALEGDTIYIPSGTYTAPTGGWQIKKGITVRGSGAGTSANRKGT